MFANFLDVIYIPPETQTAAQAVNDTAAAVGISSLGQVLVAVVAAFFLAAALISAAVFFASRGKKQEA
ncbi:MAG: hypothetical protein IJ062_11940 [Firmicutes bacterium]|nr:hypothetical protein [Bacillota bacterium]